MHTIASLLIAQAQKHQDECAYIFLDVAGEESQRLSFAQLLREAQDVACRLADLPPQARVLIALPTSAQFCHVFYGCALASKVAVPIPMPSGHRFDALLDLVRECAASCIVTIAPLQSRLRSALEEAGLAEVQVLTYADIGQREAGPCQLPDARDLALLQFTSGSTSLPKGVRLTHANLIANQEMIYQAFEHGPDTVVVGWAPLYHDQGLIGNLIQPLYAGVCCVLLEPLTFLRAPHVWLQAITRYGAHTSGGPNFCYDYCVSRINEKNCQSLDLSSWKLAFNGAEPISRQTMRQFVQKFGPYGFRAESFFVCYGLAEASLYVSGAHIDAHQLALSADAQPHIHSGRPHPFISILLRPPLQIDGEELFQIEHAGEQEICISGPNVTSGYWGGRAAELFFEHEGRRYIRTGDLGMLQDGQLLITGRFKELMIIRGRNVYPYDIERTITATHPSFLPNSCAVFALETDGKVDVIAVQEIERTLRHTLDYDLISSSVRKNVVRQHDVFLKKILFTSPGFIPITSSGKVRRSQLAGCLRETEGTHRKILAIV